MSLPPAYFDALYAADADPWRFASSEYERAKYAETIAALPHGRIGAAFEVGCSIGVLTRQLAVRCDSLCSVDVADAALEQARRRCADFPGVSFGRMQVPRDWPDRSFDLILLSEILYYLSPADIRAAAERTIQTLKTGGTVLLVHWTGETNYPCTADAAVQTFMQASACALTPDLARRHEQYRLDRLIRR